MDSILIGQKLEALRHCITRIVEKCPANVGLLATFVKIDVALAMLLDLSRHLPEKPCCWDSATLHQPVSNF
jgi:hypothetical protein